MAMNSAQKFRHVLSLLLLLCPMPALFAAGPQTAGGKAVWEPINYPKDLQFEDVFFVDPICVHSGHEVIDN